MTDKPLVTVHIPKTVLDDYMETLAGSERDALIHAIDTGVIKIKEPEA